MCERCPRIFCRDVGAEDKDCPCCRAPFERETRGEIRTWFNTSESTWARIATEFNRNRSRFVH